MKKKLAIVFGITGNWAFALGNVLLGLKEHFAVKKYDILVFHDTISIRNKIALNKIMPCKFIKYKYPYPDDLKRISGLNQFSVLCLSLFECFNLLKDYKNVLFLDVDILIQKDFSHILDIESDFISLAGNLDKSPDGAKFAKVKSCFNRPIDGYNLEGSNLGTGTILLKDNLKNYDKMADWCYRAAAKYGDSLILPDQAIMNLLHQEFNINPHTLDELYAFKPSCGMGEEKDAYILHLFGDKKFWNGIENKKWEEYNKTWLNLGGRPYEPGWDFKSRPNLFRQPSKYIKDFIKRYIF